MNYSAQRNSCPHFSRTACSALCSVHLLRKEETREQEGRCCFCHCSRRSADADVPVNQARRELGNAVNLDGFVCSCHLGQYCCLTLQRNLPVCRPVIAGVAAVSCFPTPSRPLHIIIREYRYKSVSSSKPDKQLNSPVVRRKRRHFACT